MRYLKFFLAAIFVVFAVSASSARPLHGEDASVWSPLTAFGNDLVWFDAVDAGTVTTSGGRALTWQDKTGRYTATRVSSTGPVYSATARNNTPGMVFANDLNERLGFTPTGFASGSSPSTILVVGYQDDASASRVAFGYGGGSVTRDVRAISTDQTTGYASSALFGQALTTSITWTGNDRLVMMKYTAPGVVSPTVDDEDTTSSQYAGAMVTSLSKARIGSYITAAAGDASPWSGVIQGIFIVNRAITELEKSKLIAFAAWRYNLSSALPAANPYKTGPPLVSDTGTGGPDAGYSSIWTENFNSLSLRTGSYWQGNNSGYNSPLAKGTWAFNGFNYMTGSQTYGDFGHGLFINGNYNWQATYADFPNLGLVDITSNGVTVKNSEDYPTMRAALPTVNGRTAFLSSLISTTQSMKVAPPYSRTITYTYNTRNPGDFNAAWGIGDAYNGGIGITASATGSVLTVTAITDSGPPGQNTIVPGMIIGNYGGLAWKTIASYGTATGGVGTYNLTSSVAAPVGSTAAYISFNHIEMDDTELFGHSYGATVQSSTIHAPLGSYDRCGQFTLGTEQTGVQITTKLVHNLDYYYVYTNGILTCKVASNPGVDVIQNRNHVVLNAASGMSWEPYPGLITASISGTTMTVTSVDLHSTRVFAGATVTGAGVTANSVVQPYGTNGTTGTGGTGTYELSQSSTVASSANIVVTKVVDNGSLTVRSINVKAPASNTNYVVPPTPPVPIITWGGSYSGGVIPASTPNGTVVGTLSGAAAYSVIPYLSTFTGLTASGSNLVTSGSLSVGTYDFYVCGMSTGTLPSGLSKTCGDLTTTGTPGIAPKTTVTIN